MKALVLLILATISTTSYSCFKFLWCCCLKDMQEAMDRQEKHDDAQWQQEQEKHDDAQWQQEQEKRNRKFQERVDKQRQQQNQFIANTMAGRMPNSSL